MKISSAFPSKYLRAADLQDRTITVTMSHVELEDVGDAEKKPVLHFQGKSRGMVLNRTNSKVIASGYGDDTDQWQGKPLVLFPTLVDFRGDTVEAIRVRVPKQSKPAALQPTPAGGFDERNPPPRLRPDDDDPRTGMAADLDDEIPF